MAEQTIQIADKQTLDAVNTVLESVQTNVTTIKSDASNAMSYSSSAKSLLENTTYGLQAIKNALGGGGVGAVKSIQRGNFSESPPPNNKITSKTININSVNPDKCIVLFDLIYPKGADVYSNCILYSIDNSSFTINYRIQGGDIGYIGWQLIEFY